MRCRRAGFTLTELMVVVSIIAILAAILFPVFGRAREKARQSNCQGNLTQIGVALRVYSADHYGHFPAGDNELPALVPRWLPEAGSLQCPSVSISLSGAPPPETGGCDYIYKGGYSDDDYTGFVIARDRADGVHNEGASYLFIDGHVKWVTAPYRRGSSSPTIPLPGQDELSKLGTTTPQPIPTPDE